MDVIPLGTCKKSYEPSYRWTGQVCAASGEPHVGWFQKQACPNVSPRERVLPPRLQPVLLALLLVVVQCGPAVGFAVILATTPSHARF